MSITPDIIARGLALEKERTPGPLVASIDCCDGKTMDVDLMSACTNMLFTSHTEHRAASYFHHEYSQWQEHKDAAFLAFAANHFADTLREVERLREELREREESDKAARTCEHCGAYNDGYNRSTVRMGSGVWLWHCSACDRDTESG